jgi:hypothetical protein
MPSSAAMWHHVDGHFPGAGAVVNREQYVAVDIDHPFGI